MKNDRIFDFLATGEYLLRKRNRMFEHDTLPHKSYKLGRLATSRQKVLTVDK